MSTGGPTSPAPASLGQPTLQVAPRTVWRDAWTRLGRSRVAWTCIILVAIYLVVAVAGFTPAVTRRMASSIAQSYSTPRLSTDPAYWLGTDIAGHSVFWNLVYGTRMALTVAVLASLLSSLLGLLLGTLAGFFRGLIDNLIIWLFSTVNSVPWIILMTALAYALKDRQFTLGGATFSLVGAPTIVLALGLTSWVGLCRLIRGEVIKHRQRDYVTAARAVGVRNGRILFRHILPNVFHLVIIDFTLGLVAFVQAEVILSFLGLGITDRPTWGRMIDDAKLELMQGVWWQMAAATGAIFVFSLAVNLLGDALRDALDPRLRGVD